MTPITFEEFSNFYGVRHYGDKKTYSNINSFWKLIYKKMQQKQLLFPNFELFMNYLNSEYDDAQPKYKFIHWYIINEFNKYQTNINIYFENFKEYNKRLTGFSKNNKCHNMIELKACLKVRIKRIKTDGTDEQIERKRNFLMMACYICDYLEDFPEEIPPGLFVSSTDSN
jgi:hypothetical protein